MLSALLAEADRGERDQGREDASQGAAEHDEADDGRRHARLPPDDGGGEHGDTAAPAHYGGRRDLARQHGEADPDGGQRPPVTEDGQAGRTRRQVQVPAAETRLPLPGPDFQAGVDEEDAHARGHHRAVTAPGPLRGRMRLRRGSLGGRGPRRTERSALPQPGGGDNEIEANQGRVGGPPGAGEDGGGDDQRAERGADAVGTVQEVEEPRPARQGHRRVQPGVHHSRRRADEHGRGQH